MLAQNTYQSRLDWHKESVYFLTLMAFAWAIAFVPELAFAQGGANDAIQSCGESQYGFVSKVMECVVKNLNSSLSLVNEIREKMAQFISSVIFIYVAWLGVRLLSGTVNDPLREVMQDLFLLLFVAGAVYYSGLEIFVETAMQMQKGIIESVSNTLSDNWQVTGAGRAGDAYINSIEASTGQKQVWLKLECSVIQILGIYNAETQDLLDCRNYSSFLAKIFTANTVTQLFSFVFKGETMTLILFLFSVVFIYVLVAAALIGLVMMTYISALIIFLFLIIIAPLLITFALLPITRKYFQPWISMTIIYTLIPAILIGAVVFVSLFMTRVYDDYLRDVYKEMGDIVANANFAVVQTDQETEGQGVAGSGAGTTQGAGGASTNTSSGVTSRNANQGINDTTSPRGNGFGRIGYNASNPDRNFLYNLTYSGAGSTSNGYTDYNFTSGNRNITISAPEGVIDTANIPSTPITNLNQIIPAGSSGNHVDIRSVIGGNSSQPQDPIGFIQGLLGADTGSSATNDGSSTLAGIGRQLKFSKDLQIKMAVYLFTAVLLLFIGFKLLYDLVMNFEALMGMNTPYASSSMGSVRGGVARTFETLTNPLGLLNKVGK